MLPTNRLSQTPLPDALAELGRRVQAERARRRMTQAELAERAGVSRRTLGSLERGDDVQLSTFLRVLRALDLMDRLDVMLPAETLSPLALVDRASERGR